MIDCRNRAALPTIKGIQQSQQDVIGEGIVESLLGKKKVLYILVAIKISPLTAVSSGSNSFLKEL